MTEQLDLFRQRRAPKITAETVDLVCRTLAGGKILTREQLAQATGLTERIIRKCVEKSGARLLSASGIKGIMLLDESTPIGAAEKYVAARRSSIRVQEQWIKDVQTRCVRLSLGVKKAS